MVKVAGLVACVFFRLQWKPDGRCFVWLCCYPLCKCADDQPSADNDSTCHNDDGRVNEYGSSVNYNNGRGALADDANDNDESCFSFLRTAHRTGTLDL